MVGAIICGYQGIGKSSLAQNANGYVDLESGNFFVGGVRDKDWYIVYCNIALHLARQGYRVFMSSHAVVREYLASLPYNPDVHLITCFPSSDLKSEWIAKLEHRYEESRLDKDYRALMNALDRYDENIAELSNQKGFEKIIISDMNYDLQYLVDLFYRLK